MVRSGQTYRQRLSRSLRLGLLRLATALAVLALVSGTSTAKASPPAVSALQSPINVKKLGARGDGLTDDTRAIQRGLDALAKTGGRLYVPAGTYRVGPLYFPSRVIITGDGDATLLKFRGQGGFMLSSRPQPRNLQFVHIRDLSLDMQGKADVGIRLARCWHSSVKRVNIYNLPAGTYKAGKVDFPRTGIAILGAQNRSGAYYNTLEQCNVFGNAGHYGNSGFYLSSSTEDSFQKANFNRLIQCRALYCQVGINLANGNDNYVEMCEVSNCGTGIRVKSNKNFLAKTYAESCNIGILLEKSSKYNLVFLTGSLSRTKKAIDDKGKNNMLHYKLIDLLKSYNKSTKGLWGLF